MQIRDRVAIVTGAASGIGRASALSLARAGARAVALADVDASGLDAVAAEVEASGAAALPLVTDVRDARSLERLYDEVGKLGDFSILHNNAGLTTAVPHWPDVGVEKISALIDVNLTAVIVGTRLAAPRMQRSGGGAIVNTASIAAHAPLPPEAVYCAAKAGVVMFTRCCAPLLESHGVRVNCVCPGVVETPMLRQTGIDGALADYLQPVYDALLPLQPDAIAAAVIALVEDDLAVARVVDLQNEPRVGAAT
jgi:3-oxoacyl-[acyl-carrier protein] reductase